MSEDKLLNRRGFLRMALYNSAGVCVGSMVALGKFENEPFETMVETLGKFDWGFIVDTTRCIGCGSCVRACKKENRVPDTYYRTWVERYEIDEDENVHVDSPKGALDGFAENRVHDKHVVKGFFVPKLCNHCRNSACTQVCPVGATFHTPDGVVLVDKQHCIGCGYCVQACPYGCRYITQEHENELVGTADEGKVVIGTADKCTLCYHRIHRGMDTACVYACPREARICGNLKDPKSRIRKIMHQRRYNVLKPDLATNPKCYYLGLDMEVK